MQRPGFAIQKGSTDCFGHPKFFSHILLERILEELGLNTFFSSYKGFTKLAYDVYDTLSFIAANKDKIIRRMNTNLVKKAGHSPESIYYDVTNFYFEIERPDDVIDEDGNVLKKGQRKFGICKEERQECLLERRDERGTDTDSTE